MESASRLISIDCENSVIPISPKTQGGLTYWLMSWVTSEPEAIPPKLTEKTIQLFTHSSEEEPEGVSNNGLSDDEFVMLEPETTQIQKVIPQSGVWGTLGYTEEIEETVTTGFSHNNTTLAFEVDKEAIQQELAPFIDYPEEITYQDVKEYIALLNETYPEYAIDPSLPLLEEIRRTKMAMIERGERGFQRGVGLYAAFSPDAMNTMLKIRTYQKDRAGFGEDIDYQRSMLSSFRFFYGCRDS